MNPAPSTALPGLRPLAVLLLGAALIVSAPTSSAQMNPAPANPELRPVLEEFGGRGGLEALMDYFMARLLADARTREFFEFADQPRVKRQLVEQFCVILGGDCIYSGRSMAESHEGLDIRRDEFNALVEILQDSMNARGIAFSAQNKLLAQLAPMHREVVTR
jgi:hemoglobin